MTKRKSDSGADDKPTDPNDGGAADGEDGGDDASTGEGGENGGDGVSTGEDVDGNATSVDRSVGGDAIPAFIAAIERVLTHAEQHGEVYPGATVDHGIIREGLARVH